MFQNPWLLRKIFQKKNLHAFHPPEHVTETRREILSNCARIFTA